MLGEIHGSDAHDLGVVMAGDYALSELISSMVIICHEVSLSGKSELHETRHSLEKQNMFAWIRPFANDP